MPLESQAFNYFLYHHLATPTTKFDVVFDHLRYVEPFWRTSANGTPLRLAVSALSHAVFGRVKAIPDSIEIGVRTYGDALKATSRALLTRTGVPIEHLVLTIMLLSNYEVRQFSEGPSLF